MHDSPVKAGDIVADKYRVEHVLGIGGMGVVVAAMHLQLGETVALKCLTERGACRPGAVTRFFREARATVKIKSEHVARVYDVGTLDDGTPYLVMEHLHGQDLSEALRARGPLPLAQVAEFLLQACEAIAEAHGLGIVHRDLKPSNLFVTARPDGSPVVKVLDFGISKTSFDNTADSGASLTHSLAIMGSPLYMSPEQLRSAKHVDERSDIWSLGVTLHELIAGAPPFGGDHVAAVLNAVLHEPPMPLRAVAPSAPEALEALVQRCLAKDPADRFASIAELARALSIFAPARAQVSVQRIDNLPRRSGPSAVGVRAHSTSEMTVASLDGVSGEGSLALVPPPDPPRGTGEQAWGTTHNEPARVSQWVRAHAGATAASVVALLIFAFGARTALSPSLPPAPAQSASQASRLPDEPAIAAMSTGHESSPPAASIATPVANAPMVAPVASTAKTAQAVEPSMPRALPKRAPRPRQANDDHERTW